MSPSIAPLISGWQRRVGGLPGPYPGPSASGVASGGTGANGLLVELLVDGTWTDITKYVMVRDTSGQISITRGQSAEGQQPSPGSCSFQLNNRDGRFSPANPVSPLYGKIGRNTQVRVSVTKGDDKSYRFWGEISEWPEDWDTTDTDVWVDINAAGILKRLNQGNTPLRSTMYRGLTSMATAPPVAYWPCEDGASSTSLASALSGAPAMQLIGSPTLASDTGFLSSTALPVMNGGSLLGTIPTYTVTGQSQVRFLMYLPTAPADGTQLIKVKATGSVPYWAVTYATGGAMAIKGLDSDGLTVLVQTSAIVFGLDNERVRVSMEFTQSGANVNWALSIIQPTGSASGLSGTFTGVTVGRMTSVQVAPGQTLTGAVFGHISVQSAVTNVLDLGAQVIAFVGEAPTTRLFRLCTEQGINCSLVGGLSSDAMGPQLPNTFMNLLEECVDVDQGTLFEREVAFGLAYRARQGEYNQSAQLTLSYPGNQLAAVPKPVPDDQTVRNSITASRPNGSSAVAVLSSGPLSILDPPLGVGTYSDSPSLNVATDDMLYQHAAWRLHLGTVAEPRYPAISINLAHPTMAAQRLAALNTLFGHRIVVQSPPSRIGGDISQIVIGISETITHFEHRITFVCQPESPYHVVTLDSATRARLDTDGATLAGDMGPASTNVQIATTGALLSTTDTPYDVLIGGEQMTVTAVFGSSSPQQVFMTRSVNGVVKPHQSGESVHLAVPVVAAL